MAAAAVVSGAAGLGKFESGLIWSSATVVLLLRALFDAVAACDEDMEVAEDELESDRFKCDPRCSEDVLEEASDVDELASLLSLSRRGDVSRLWRLF